MSMGRVNAAYARHLSGCIGEDQEVICEEIQASKESVKMVVKGKTYKKDYGLPCPCQMNWLEVARRFERWEIS
jgi:hypothetical protein